MKTILAFIVTFFTVLCQAQVTPGLVGHFRLDSLNHTDETHTANGYISNRGNGDVIDTSDRYNTKRNATYFKGGIIEAGKSSRGIVNEVSVSAWIKTNYRGAPIKIICNQYLCSSEGGFLLYIKEGKVAFDVRDVSNTSSRYLSSGLSCTVVGDNYWHFVVGTLSSTGLLSIWVDGRHESTQTFSSITSLYSGCDLAIGGLASENSKNKAESFQGFIDDVRIYNRPLKLSEIDTLYKYPKLIQTSMGCGEPHFAIYPIPTSDRLHIETNLLGFRTLQVYNDIGQLVMEQPFTTDFNLSHLASGCYFLRLYNSLYGDRVEKIMVVR